MLSNIIAKFTGGSSCSEAVLDILEFPAGVALGAGDRLEGLDCSRAAAAVRILAQVAWGDGGQAIVCQIA